MKQLHGKTHSRSTERMNNMKANIINITLDNGKEFTNHAKLLPKSVSSQSAILTYVAKVNHTLILNLPRPKQRFAPSRSRHGAAGRSLERGDARQKNDGSAVSTGLSKSLL